MKRLALIASVGLALAVVVAAQALRGPEREPVTPIELSTPVERSDDAAAKTPAGRTTTHDRKAPRPATTGREAPVTQSPPSEAPMDDDRADDRSPTPEPPPPPRENDDSDDDADTGDDDADTGDDDAGDG